MKTKNNTIKGMVGSTNKLFIAMIAVLGITLISFKPAPTAVSTSGNVSIKGVITDSYSKKPIMGATISVKGTDTKTTTKKNGSYKISVPKEAKMLIVTCPGYEQLEVAISGRTEINVAISLKYDNPDTWN
jgi:hypothetical protein